MGRRRRLIVNRLLHFLTDTVLGADDVIKLIEAAPTWAVSCAVVELTRRMETSYATVTGSDGASVLVIKPHSVQSHEIVQLISALSGNIDPVRQVDGSSAALGG